MPTCAPRTCAAPTCAARTSGKPACATCAAIRRPGGPGSSTCGRLCGCEMASSEADVIVIGAGAVGISTAYHLAAAGRKVTVLEKEPGPALHQSGRNSGVIHAGYNLKPGSNKARFCIEGSKRLREYCAQKGVPVRGGGILVTARPEPETRVLAELERPA